MLWRRGDDLKNGPVIVLVHCRSPSDYVSIFQFYDNHFNDFHVLLGTGKLQPTNWPSMNDQPTRHKVTPMCPLQTLYDVVGTENRVNIKRC